MRMKQTLPALRGFLMAFVVFAMSLCSYGVLAPKTPTASDGKYSSYVKISYGRVTGAQKYQIRRSTTTDFDDSISIVTTKSLSYNDTTAVAGTVYYYWVLPVDSNGDIWYIASRYNSGYRKASSSAKPSTGGKSLIITGVSTVTAGDTIALYAVYGGTYVKPTSVTYSGVRYGTVYKYQALSKSAFGYVKGLKPGTVKVTIKYNGVTAKKSIVVKKSTASLSIGGDSTVSVGGTKSLYALYGGVFVKPASVTYSGSKYGAVYKYSSLGAASSFGYITGLKPGTVIVTIKYNGQTAKKTITVTGSGFGGSGGSSSGGSIQGPTTLSSYDTGYYSLYVGGKQVTPTKWSKSSSIGTLYKSGARARFYVGNPPTSSYSLVTIRATYQGKTYSKTVKVYK